MHRHGKMHHQHAGCNEAMGAALAKQVETVDMNYTHKNEYVSIMLHQNWALLSKHDVYHLCRAYASQHMTQ